MLLAEIVYAGFRYFLIATSEFSPHWNACMALSGLVSRPLLRAAVAKFLEGRAVYTATALDIDCECCCVDGERVRRF
jgi:hypothetical protein